MSLWSAITSFFGGRSEANADTASTSWSLANMEQQPLPPSAHAYSAASFGEHQDFLTNLNSVASDVVSAPFKPLALLNEAINTHTGTFGRTVQQAQMDVAKGMDIVSHAIAAGIVQSGDSLHSNKSILDKIFQIDPGQNPLKPGGMKTNQPLPVGEHSLGQDWRDTAGTSPGQALAYLSTPGMPRPAGAGLARYQSGIGQTESGLLDGAFQWFLSPQVIAGKGAKAGLEASTFKLGDAESNATFAHQFEQGLSGGKNTAAFQFVKDITDGDSVTNEARFRNYSTQSAALGHLTGHVNDLETNKDIILAAAADAGAIGRLADNHASILADMQHVQSLREPLLGLAPEAELPAGHLTGVSPGWDFAGLHNAIATNQDALNYLDRINKDLQAKDKVWKSALDLVTDESGNATPSLERIGSKFAWAQKIQASLNDNTTARRMAGTGWWSSSRGNGSWYSRPWNMVAYIGDSTPAGWISFKGPSAQDSMAEMNATLAEIKGMSSDERRQWADRWMGAPLHAHQLETLTALEKRGASLMFDHYFPDVDPKLREEKLKEYLNDYNTNRNSAIEAAKVNYGVDRITGETLHFPTMGSMFENTTPVMDFRALEDILAKNTDGVRSWMVAGKVAAESIGDPFYELWRPAVLLRLGYTTRNVAEGLARVWALNGHLANTDPLVLSRHSIVSQAGENAGRLGGRVFKRYSLAGARRDEPYIAARLDEINRLKSSLQSKLDDINAETAELVRPDTGRPYDMASYTASKELAATHVQNVQADLDALDMEAQVLRMRREDIRAYKKYSQRGAGWRDRQIRGLQNQGSVTVPGVWTTEHANALKLSTSADTTLNTALSGPDQHLYQRLSTKYGWGNAAPGDPQYFQSLERVVNDQWMNDALMGQIAKGQDILQSVDWLHTRSGSKYLKELRAAGFDTNAENLAAQLHTEYESLLPDQELRDRLAAGEHLYAGVLSDHLKGRDDLVDVRALSQERAVAHKIAAKFEEFKKKSFQNLGSLPENRMVRHPFAHQLWDQHMEQLIREADSRGEIVDGARINEFGKIATRYAARETKRWLYTVERYSRGANGMRYISPFYASAENSLKTWAKIIARDPSVLARGLLIAHAMANAADPNGNIRVKLPDKIAPGQALKDMRILGISTASIQSIILGNQPWYSPGAGPLAGLPANVIVQHLPLLGALAEKTGILPFGASAGLMGDIEQLAPSWAQRLLAMIRKSADPGYSASVRAYMAEELKQEADRTRPPMSQTEMEKQALGSANQLYWWRLATSLVSPVSVTYMSADQFYYDQWRKYETQYGINAASKFWHDYPDAYGFMMSASDNQSGMQSSTSAYKIAAANPDLIHALDNLNPSDPTLIGMLTNSGTYDYTKDYNSSVAAWQRSTNINPADPGEPFIKAAGPGQSMRQTNVSVGWSQYMALSDRIRAALVQRGLTSLNDSGAADLRAVKDAMVQSLQASNPDWYSAYMTSNSAATLYHTIQGLELIVSDEKFMGSAYGKSQKWTAVEDYLSTRQRFVDELAARKAAGGSGSLPDDVNGSYAPGAQNVDLALQWQAFVQGLADSNSDFNALYERYLTNDNLQAVPQP